MASYWGSSARKRKTGDEPIYVYVLQADGMQRYKIGIATDVEARVKSMQPHSPVKLSVIAHSVMSRAAERELHARFAHGRLHNEWFSLSDDDLHSLLSAVQGVDCYR